MVLAKSKDSDTAPSVSLARDVSSDDYDVSNVAGQAQQADNEKEVRVDGLIYPCDMQLPVLSEAMYACERFACCFEKNSNTLEQEKIGYVSLYFDCLLKAEAFCSAMKESVQRNEIKGIVTAKVVNLSAEELPVKDSVVSKCYLKVDGLLAAANESLIRDIFAEYNVQEIANLSDVDSTTGTKTATLKFSSEQDAENAMLELNDFELDDGVCSSSLKISFLTPENNNNNNVRLSTTEFVAQNEKAVCVDDETRRLQIEAEAQSSDTRVDACQLMETNLAADVPTTDTEIDRTVDKQPPVVHPPTVEIDVDQISAHLREYMRNKRINWAEMNTVKELWVVLNQLTSEIGWQPEEMLKLGMKAALEYAVQEFSTVQWLAQHLKHLIQLWNDELMLEKRSETRKELLMAVEEDLSYLPKASPYCGLKKKKKKYPVVRGVGGILERLRKEANDAAQLSTKMELKQENGRKKQQQNMVFAASAKSAAVKNGETSTTTTTKSARHRHASISSKESGEASSSSEDEAQEWNTVNAKFHNNNSSSSSSRPVHNAKNDIPSFHQYYNPMVQAADAPPDLAYNHFVGHTFPDISAHLIPMMTRLMPMFLQFLQQQNFQMPLTTTNNNSNIAQQQQLYQQLQMFFQQVGFGNARPPAPVRQPLNLGFRYPIPQQQQQQQQQPQQQANMFDRSAAVAANAHINAYGSNRSIIPPRPSLTGIHSQAAFVHSNKGGDSATYFRKCSISTAAAAAACVPNDDNTNISAVSFLQPTLRSLTVVDVDIRLGRIGRNGR
ncbi:hypothetical protein T07_15214 [Trichinella nelsoni]|uniref:RRM domain-containing protein n=1 Tax=Trichinella nelsoni TaxID=6336 RepID=A0A0V0SDE2_9BILA|nr:hypothetical protein T07_15214 [Trichinella nelsoni]